MPGKGGGDTGKPQGTALEGDRDSRSLRPSPEPLPSPARLLRLQPCPAGAPQDYTGHDDTVHLCRFSPSGRRLLSASHSAVFVWELTGA